MTNTAMPWFERHDVHALIRRGFFMCLFSAPAYLVNFGFLFLVIYALHFHGISFLSPVVIGDIIGILLNSYLFPWHLRMLVRFEIIESMKAKPGAISFMGRVIGTVLNILPGYVCNVAFVASLLLLFDFSGYLVFLPVIGGDVMGVVLNVVFFNRFFQIYKSLGLTTRANPHIDSYSHHECLGVIHW